MIEPSLCTISFGPQTGLSAITYSTALLGGIHHIHLHANVGEIQYSTSGALCGETSGTTATGDSAQRTIEVGRPTP